MGSIQWDGIYGESDTFLSNENVAAATAETEAFLEERPYSESTGDVPDLDEARVWRSRSHTGPRSAS